VRYKEDFIQGQVPADRIRKLRELGDRLAVEHHVTVLKTFPTLGIQRLKLPPGDSVKNAIQTLKNLDQIKFVEPNYKIYPLFADPPRDKYWKMGPLYLWGMDRIKMQQAWTASQTGIADNIIVAVLDTGIDHTHLDLAANIWNNPGEYGKTQYEDDDMNGIIDDIHGVNYCWWTDPIYGAVNPTGNPTDNNFGHGTAVAGVIGAVVDNPNDGDAGYVAGVHRKAKLMALKVLCAPSDPEESTVVNAAAAIDYAWLHGATVLNASWYVATGTGKVSPLTGQATGSEVLREAIARARDHKALFVAAAGNSSAERDNDLISIYPANYGRSDADDYLDNVIAVAATWDMCTDGNPVNFNPSSPLFAHCDNGSTPSEALWEQSHFGLKTVQIAAPGWETYTTMSLSLDPRGITNPSGTSMAAPHVAGCAALLQAKRTANNALAPFSGNELKSILINSADGIGLSGISNGRRLNCSRAFIGDQAPPAQPTGLRIQ
jgi:subtilisin family serine protease